MLHRVHHDLQPAITSSSGSTEGGIGALGKAEAIILPRLWWSRRERTRLSSTADVLGGFAAWQC